MKTCIKCNELKSYEFFTKQKSYKDGYKKTCKNCLNKNFREYYFNNKEKLIEKKKKYNLENKENLKEYYKLYYLNNKEQIKEYQKENKENIAKIKKEYYLNNKEKSLETIRKYNLKRRKTDSLYKLKCNLRTLISKSIKKQGYSKKSKTFNILGCTPVEFKQYLEKQFTNGMTWNNYGEWHLDHIYPISLSKDEEELIRLNHYTNFQPLWALDNIKKGNKIIDNKQLKLV